MHVNPFPKTIFATIQAKTIQNSFLKLLFNKTHILTFLQTLCVLFFFQLKEKNQRVRPNHIFKFTVFTRIEKWMTAVALLKHSMRSPINACWNWVYLI